MLRRKILRKIYFTTLIVFILFVISSFTMNKNITNIKVEYPTHLSNIYLLDDNNYLLEVSIIVKDNVLESIPIVINNLKADNKHYSGLRGIIPNKTKLQDMKLDSGLLTIDFNQELFNINAELEEKVLESIVYSLLNFKEINRVKITIDGKELNYLPKSKIKIDEFLTKEFGINKEYHLTSMQDVSKVILYYYEVMNENKYYVPITKYLNSKDDKIKVIIDNLKNSYLSETNLMTYLNDKIKINKYEQNSDTITIYFQDILSISELPDEEVIYVLSNSIFDSTDIQKIIFMNNDQIIKIKDK